MQKEEEWSKDRIKAEMDDLKPAIITRLIIAIPALLLGALLTLGGILSYGIQPSEQLPFGIVLVIIGLFSLKSWREKSRKYYEIKDRL